MLWSQSHTAQSEQSRSVCLEHTPQLQVLFLTWGFTSLSGGTALISLSHTLTINCWCPAFRAFVCAWGQAGMLSVLPVYARLCRLINNSTRLCASENPTRASGWRLTSHNEGITFCKRKFVLLCLALYFRNASTFLKSSLSWYMCTCVSCAELIASCCSLVHPSIHISFSTCRKKSDHES